MTMDTDRPTPRRRNPGSARTVRRPEERTIAGWRSWLAVFVAGSLLIEAGTGIWIYVAPFSVSSQIQLMLHTFLGLALLVPYAVYQVHHWRTWGRQKLSIDMVLGYAVMAVVIVCLVSGAVVTWQGAFGRKLSPTWDLLHLVTGLGAGLLLTLHVLFALARRLPAARKSSELSGAIRSFSVRGTFATAATGLLILSVASLWPKHESEFPPPAEYGLPAFAQQFDEYRGSVFAPTYARTASGMFVEPDVLANSASCGTSRCHETILAEWEPSAHRFSAINPPFQQVQRNFAQDREPAETRYCAGCHDPISLFAGAKDIQMMDVEAPGLQEGISCVVCHSISEVDQRGNADYVLTPPSKYVWEHADGWRKAISDFLIRSYSRQHLADYDRNIMRTPEYCGSCHKQFIPEALNRFGVSPSQNQYDEWRQSHWHSDDPELDLSCRDCHMRLVYDSTDPGRGEAGDTRRSPDDNAHRHHGTIATNALMPEVLKLPHWENQVRLTKEWIAGETVLPEIAALWPDGPVASLDLSAPDEVATGEEVTVRVVLANRKVGHNYTTGPLDFVRAWVHLRVYDQDGGIVAEWGAIDPETRRIVDTPGSPHEPGNSRVEGTLVLEGQPLDEHGNRLLQHELWKKAGGAGQRVVFPHHSDQHSYRFTVPASARGELRLQADLNFRRYRQEFLDLVVPDMERDSGVFQPTMRQTSSERRIAVRAGPAQGPAGGAGGGR